MADAARIVKAVPRSCGHQVHIPQTASISEPLVVPEILSRKTSVTFPSKHEYRRRETSVENHEPELPLYRRRTSESRRTEESALVDIGDPSCNEVRINGGCALAGVRDAVTALRTEQR